MVSAEQSITCQSRHHDNYEVKRKRKQKWKWNRSEETYCVSHRNNNRKIWFSINTCVILLSFVQVSNRSMIRLVSALYVPCNTTRQCQQLVREGSECIAATGLCSNPFYKSGCLANVMKDDTNYKSKRSRVCSSTDSPEAEFLGYCTATPSDIYPWNYTELRLMANDWDSVFISTWIVQIVLSEILGVPTTVEMGKRDVSMDFYDKAGRLDPGIPNDWDSIRRANEIGDCRSIQQPSINESEYISCAHVNMEVWYDTPYEQLKQSNAVEQGSYMSMVGNVEWFVPKFTAERDPTLATFTGLMGEKNRQKLADRFLRPIKWIDYCKEISATNCSLSDDVAKRPPIDDTEASSFFFSGLYTGHFRKTGENNCTLHPTTCSGHIADFPCSSNSQVQGFAFHMNISLVSSGDEPYSGGYTYSQMIEIWYAANATKSNVIMTWWYPERLVSTFAGTDAEFIPLERWGYLTQECYDNWELDACNPDKYKRVGSNKTLCNTLQIPFEKGIACSVKNMNASNIEDSFMQTRNVKQSPAFDVIHRYDVTTLQMNAIFEKWLKTTTSLNQQQQQHFTNPREAVCQWVVENYDHLVQKLIPPTFPRTIVNISLTDPLSSVALSCAVCVLGFVIFIAGSVYQNRNQYAIVIAQIDFLYLLLLGQILVQCGSMLLTIPPTDRLCIVAPWVVNLGFTLMLVPLLVKISALQKLLASGKQMKRLKINRSNLFTIVGLITMLMVVYLTVWTIVDPPNQLAIYEVTDDTMPNTGETIVNLFYVCQSSNNVWIFVGLIWRFILLFWASILAFLTRKHPDMFNEAQTLGIISYWQTTCIVITFLLYTFSNDADNITLRTNLRRYLSFLQSLDVVVVCFIYFVPKLLTKNETALIDHAGSTSNPESIPYLSQGMTPKQNDRSFISSSRTLSAVGTSSRKKSQHFLLHQVKEEEVPLRKNFPKLVDFEIEKAQGTSMPCTIEKDWQYAPVVVRCTVEYKDGEDGRLRTVRIKGE